MGDYHYQAFGVPKLALKREESEPLIIAPYATFLALSVDRRSAMANLRKMESLGWFGAYGFFEAADYTAGRKRFGAPRFELVREWMVHHQGMSFLSLANFLCDKVVQRMVSRRCSRAGNRTASAGKASGRGVLAL